MTNVTASGFASFGEVVNDAIVLIERVNENLAAGMAFFESIIKGGARRFRAIFLTTISTAGGLLPLIAEKDLQAKSLIPMALSLAAGVIFATVLTLGAYPQPDGGFERSAAAVLSSASRYLAQEGCRGAGQGSESSNEAV
jgi:Cu/Ag efflux pump CusA